MPAHGLTTKGIDIKPGPGRLPAGAVIALASAATGFIAGLPAGLTAAVDSGTLDVLREVAVQLRVNQEDSSGVHG